MSIDKLNDKQKIDPYALKKSDFLDFRLPLHIKLKILKEVFKTKVEISKYLCVPIRVIHYWFAGKQPRGIHLRLLNRKISELQQGIIEYEKPYDDV